MSGSAWYPASAGSWLTLQEARERSYGGVEWWGCEGAKGERILEIQHRPDGPKDRPVWSNGNGKMYLGGWVKHPTKECYQWDGFGVYCRKDGRLFIGSWEEGKLSGYAKRVWLPAAPHWVRNSRESSVIQSNSSAGEQQVGLPFIYIGNFRGNWKEDPEATVILKDGTTRIGPWEKNEPVGDWWKDHKESFTTPVKLAQILSFAPHKPDVAFKPTPMRKEERTYDDPPDLFQSRTGSTEGTDDSAEVADINEADVSKISVSTHDISFMSKATQIRHNVRKKADNSEPKKQVFDEEQLETITEWLTEEVIQFDASHDEMETYARNFLDVGLHSIEMIQEMSTPADVASFTWMKDFHRRRFLFWVNKAAQENKEHWCRMIASITAWLCEQAIGYDADLMEMGMYAQNFIHLGFHSVAMIKEVCTFEDVQKMSWMKPIHRRLLCRSLPGKAKHSSPRRTTSV